MAGVATIKPVAARLNIVLEQGAHRTITVAVADGSAATLDFTGYDGRMQVRESYENTAVLLELTTANGKLVTGPAAALLQLEFAPADTTGATWTEGVYDVEVVNPGGQVMRVLKGRISIDLEVTR